MTDTTPESLPDNETSRAGERIMRLRKMNRSYLEVSAELGVSVKTVQRWMRRYEAEMRSKTINAMNNPKGMK